ncbi:hypothetical protein SAMN02910456_00634 [Ruminococcaceae bacterium YRB3002]|nr:hypothetical protein SAMN02910456_00634 [Ruminococcaceae bacterium YRB3002]
MGFTQFFTIYLRDGSVISFIKPYNFYDRGIIEKCMENAANDEIVTIRNGDGEDLLIPKKNILFVKLRIEEGG